MKTVSRYLLRWLPIAGFIIGFAVFQKRDQRTLGIAKIEGTDLHCRVDQTRSIGNYFGMGSNKLYFSIVDPSGTWIQKQERAVFGHAGSGWAKWDAPETIATRKKESLTTLPFELSFEDYELNYDITVGIN